MFMVAKVCRDIQTDVYFLGTCVKKTYKYDWVKLKRVLIYLKGTRKLKITLRVGDMSVVK